MSLFPPNPFGCFGSSPLIGPYGWFGGSWGQLSDGPAPSPEDKAKPLEPIQTTIGSMPIMSGLSAPGSFPGFVALNQPLSPWLLWEMAKYPTIAFAKSIINKPWLAGNEEIEISPFAPDGMKDRLEKWKEEAERYVDPIWQMTKEGAGECVSLGNFLWEIIYERQDGLTVPVDAVSHLMVNVNVRLFWDKFRRFSGFRVNGEERDARYAFLAVNEPHKDRVFGYSRSQNCIDAWWRALQSNLNADKTERKGSGIQFSVGLPMGASFVDKDGKPVVGDDVAKTFMQSGATGNCFSYPLYLFSQESIEQKPELAEISPVKIERYDWGDIGPVLMAHLARLTRTDVDIIRGYLRPEREAMEGQNGTKAEAGTHGAIGTTDSELVHAMILRQFSKQVLDRYCVTNYPGYEPGMLYYKPTPLSDPQQEFLQQLEQALATDKATGPELVKHFNLRGLAERTEVPILSEDDVAKNEVIAQQKADEAQQQAIDLAKASAKPLPSANGKAATNGTNGKPRIAASADARPHLSRLLGDMLNEPRMTYLGDEYEPIALAADDEGGHWVTLPNGEHAFIGSGGQIEKGPKALVGKNPSDIGGDIRHHREHTDPATPRPRFPTRTPASPSCTTAVVRNSAHSARTSFRTTNTAPAATSPPTPMRPRDGTPTTSTRQK